MKQPIRGKTKTIKKQRKNSKTRSNPPKKRTSDEEYGTSKLERDFAREFLDRLNLKYTYQYEAKDIKRFFDFAVTLYDDYPLKFESKNGLRSVVQADRKFLIAFLIEVDGDYYHANPNLFNEKKLNPMQKHNLFVDGLKTEWALKNGLTLLRFWEDDIRNRPEIVIKTLKEKIKEAKKRMLILEDKRKPH